MGSLILFIVLVVIFVLLNVLDGHSTYRVVTKTSINNERNPVARQIFKVFGALIGIIVLKSILVPLVFLMFYYFSFRNNEMNLILLIANVFYTTVVIHNYNVVKRLNFYAQFEDDDDD